MQTFAPLNAIVCTTECNCISSWMQNRLQLIPFIMPFVTVELDRLFQSTSYQDLNDFLLHMRIERLIPTQQIIIVALTHYAAHKGTYHANFPWLHLRQCSFESVSHTHLRKKRQDETPMESTNSGFITDTTTIFSVRSRAANPLRHSPAEAQSAFRQKLKSPGAFSQKLYLSSYILLYLK